MKNEKNIFEELKELLENLTDSELVEVWNEYCDNNRCYDDKIEYMDDFDCLMEGNSPTKILESVAKDFSTYDDYFKFGIYGCKSFGDPSDYIYFDDLANYILDNDEDFDNNGIREFLDEQEDKETAFEIYNDIYLETFYDEHEEGEPVCFDEFYNNDWQDEELKEWYLSVKEEQDDE